MTTWILKLLAPPHTTLIWVETALNISSLIRSKVRVYQHVCSASNSKILYTAHCCCFLCTDRARIEIIYCVHIRSILYFSSLCCVCLCIRFSVSVMSFPYQFTLWAIPELCKQSDSVNLDCNCIRYVCERIGFQVLLTKFWYFVCVIHEQPSIVYVWSFSFNYKYIAVSPVTYLCILMFCNLSHFSMDCFVRRRNFISVDWLLLLCLDCHSNCSWFFCWK
jgi:hypothetical protein